MNEQPNPHKIKPEALTRAAVTEIAVQMNLLKARLGGLHLFKTMRALDEATRALGYEAADRLKGNGVRSQSMSRTGEETYAVTLGQLRAIRVALGQCEEYFEQRADAEYFTDSPSPCGNEEMQLLVEVQSALRNVPR